MINGEKFSGMKASEADSKPGNQQEEMEQLLEEALQESFPASDPIAVIITKVPKKEIRQDQ